MFGPSRFNIINDAPYLGVAQCFPKSGHPTVKIHATFSESCLASQFGVREQEPVAVMPSMPPMVVSDEFEPVSTRPMRLPLMLHKGRATQRERQRG